jgi:aspartyl-tRNA synthetase
MVFTQFATLNQESAGKQYTVGGFVHTIRDHGGLFFLDLRSGNDLLQCVVEPTTNPEAFATAQDIHPEYVLKVTGDIRLRSDETINSNLPTGHIELVVSTIEIVSKAQTLPFNIQAVDKDLANEEIRLKYRYLDLRREKLKTLMQTRSKFILATRNWFAQQDFVDVQTPLLANSSPEGARDFLVPSRVHPGKFYALPQAPQQFKQLLMVAGFNKYFQVAVCFRDEDPRSDRLYGGFTQFDAEIAWAEPQDIRELSWELINTVFGKFTTKRILPEFKTVSYSDSIEMYGSDKPDLRFDLAWQDVKDVFAGSGFGVFEALLDKPNSRIQALRIPGGSERFSRSDLDKIQDIGRNFGLPGIAYIQYNADGAKSPIFKFFGDKEEIKKQEIAKALSAQTGDLVLFVAHENKGIVHKAQHAMRIHIANHLGLIDDSVLQFVWINDMPFFEEDEKTGGVAFGHNPFSVWEGGLDKLLQVKAQGKEALLDLKAKQYDIAVNGYEVLSGGVRNQDPESLQEVFRICGYSDEEVTEKFGHMVEAYSYGAPTHAGFAWGIERLFMVLQGEENVREVDAFPTNGSGVSTMMNYPSTVRPGQLKELRINTLE